MNLTKEESQKLLFDRWKELQNSHLTGFCEVWRSLIQNDITISKKEFKEILKTYIEQKQQAVEDFENLVIESDKLAKETAKHVQKYMIS